jgi:hypothetical protein
MKPVEFKDQTQVLNKPKDMTEEQCGSLPVKQHIIDLDGSKYNAFDCVWQLSNEEVAEIAISGKIRLQVIASGMPPVLLMVEPKEEPETTDNVISMNPNVKYWPESTSVARTQYIPEENILEVEYRSGRVYHYKNFPAILFPDVVAAKSIGQFINKNIKGQFEEIEVVNG